MKVKELIKQLSAMDQEADVWLYDGEWSENPCNFVTPWLHQNKWGDTGQIEKDVFETPRVLLE